MIQRRTFKNTRTDEEAQVKDATEAKIMKTLNVKWGDVIEVSGADYHYEVIVKAGQYRLRTVYHTQ